MGHSVTRKLFESRIVDGEWIAGGEIGISVDQTLMHDASGPTIIQELEVLGLREIATDVTVVYVDHNLLQADHKSADDHEFLRTSARKLGMHYSPAGNGISHPVHLETFARPGHVLIGGDSHSVGAGAVGMLAIGAGGMDVALSTAGMPYYLVVPKVFGVELVGELPEWVSTKDVALEMLRRHTVRGAVGHVVEYFGSGLDKLSVWDRHTLANMGLELGGTATVFPSDRAVREFLEWQGRPDEFVQIAADPGAEYDKVDRIDLSTMVPMVARPHSPDNVVPVTDVEGVEIRQAYVGSSANPSYRDFSIIAEILRGHRAAEGVALDINPSTRSVLAHLSGTGLLLNMVQAGARIHQAGCTGCVGIGQAPASGVSSIRTTPRNFKGRTGTLDDSVYLASPETVAASALTGRITDPRSLGDKAPTPRLPQKFETSPYLIQGPLSEEQRASTSVVRGPNIKRLPEFEPLPNQLALPVLLRVGDNVSTDDIMPAQQEQIAWRSDIDAFSDFVFCRWNPNYVSEAKETRSGGGHAIVADQNYGQGSAREHAALSPRYLGLRVVLAVSFGRIYHRNLVNFGILPVRAEDPEQLAEIKYGDHLDITDLVTSLRSDAREVNVTHRESGSAVRAVHDLSRRQVELVLAGGVLEMHRGKLTGEAGRRRP